MKITRRRFTTGTMVAATTAAIGFSTACSRKKHYDVVVMGGGISGLNTALLLADRGLSVVVLEADSQVGGRIKTVQTSDGEIDVGASQVGLGYARVKNACRSLGLNLIPEDRDLLPFGMHFQGNWLDPVTWSDNPLNVCIGEERSVPPMLMARSLVAKYNPLRDLDDWLSPQFKNWDISLRQLLTREGHSAQAIQLSESTVPGISIDQTSVLRMFQEQLRGRYERGFSNMDFVPPLGTSNPFGEENARSKEGSLASIYNIEGGCQQLPIAMSRQLGDTVRLNKRVIGVDMTDESATVTCEDRSRFTGRYLVSSLPLTVLRNVKINASSNERSRETIQNIPYANTARMYVEVKKPFWEHDDLPASFSTDGPMGMFWAIDNHGVDRAQRAMFVLVGNAGQSISSIKNPEDFLISELVKLRPASKGLIKKLTYKDWASDPLQKGCGFSFGPGQMSQHVRDIAKPWQVMHFAGEHTRRQDFGMEAALESSERVAFEILDHEGRAG